MALGTARFQPLLLPTFPLTIVTTTELAVVTLGGVMSDRPGNIITFHGWANVTGGTSTTAVTLRIRDGSGITGTVRVTTGAVIVTGATNADEYDIDGQYVPTGELASYQATLTVQLTAAAANGSVGAANLWAEIV